MEILHGNYLVAAAVFCFVVTLTSSVPVSSITCTSGGTQCPTNSACVTTGTEPFKCKCNAAFKEGAGTAENTCVPKVLEDTCTAGAHAECAGVANAECRAADNKCGCPVQYVTGSNTCTLRAVGDSCTAHVDCSGDANSECSNETPKKCTCKTGYTPINKVCKRGLKDPCNADPDCSAVSNAECVGADGSKVCTCKANYKEDSGQCSSANGLQTPLSASMALLLSFLTIVFTRLR